MIFLRSLDLGGCGQRGRCPSQIGVSVDHHWLLFVLLATLPNARTAPSSQNQAIRKNSTIPQSNFYYSWGPSPEFQRRSDPHFRRTRECLILPSICRAISRYKSSAAQAASKKVSPPKKNWRWWSKTKSLLCQSVLRGDSW